MKSYDIIVIGGGASGLTAALCAKEAKPSAAVVLCEALPRVGKKLLATGNGRCNLMNAEAEAGDYYGDPEFILPALTLYQREYGKFWDSLGLRLASEEEGRVYPACNQASAVLDVLRLGLAERKIEEITDCPVKRISPSGSGFALETPAEPLFAKKVILATGGKAGKGLGENSSFLTLLKPLGHSFVLQHPGLTWLKVPKEYIAGLKGIRYRGGICLYEGETLLAKEEGEVLFQEEALSGIAAMQLSLSAPGKTHLRAEMRLLDGDFDLFSRAERFEDRPAGELLTGALNKQLALLALKRCKISPASPVSSLTTSALGRLKKELTAWGVPVFGTGDFSQAQVMLGGAATCEFDKDTLESRKAPGLYACGELLNVTGPCGGYNLEWAWACGMLAGRKAAQSL